MASLDLLLRTRGRIGFGRQGALSRCVTAACTTSRAFWLAAYLGQSHAMLFDALAATADNAPLRGCVAHGGASCTSLRDDTAVKPIDGFDVLHHSGLNGSRHA